MNVNEGATARRVQILCIMRQFRLCCAAAVDRRGRLLQRRAGAVDVPDQQQYVSGPPGGAMDPTPSRALSGRPGRNRSGNDQVLESGQRAVELAPEASIEGPATVAPPGPA